MALRLRAFCVQRTSTSPAFSALPAVACCNYNNIRQQLTFAVGRIAINFFAE